MPKPLYRVDLSAQQAECEANYQRLLCLIPVMLPTKGVDLSSGTFAAAGDLWRYAMRSDSGLQCGHLVLTVQSLAPYTTILELKHFPDANGLVYEQPWHTTNEFVLRLYHDVEMAEVAACNKHWYFRPRYSPQNNKGFQIDEKAQINRFLGELLGNCLRWGHSINTKIETVQASNDWNSS